ncbi:23S rRNA methyltransferase [Asticcacaulis sp. AC460]|uniref:RlmE family RNA methyltransferase n=1 Tax=Asticcacaulis sp. AC460 TaxID=1282360 RepID=UPI0003C3F5A0|nr:RlmE family RNA methyltransferase [Asticcacaulis sp. AC460]ESQ89885.1 23S rRNA methyltransferase [Asticcacaulis sp. AC460]
MNDTPEEPERRRMVKPPEGGTLAGRGKGHTAVKTAKYRTQSSAKWLERQLNDPYVQQAKAEGWRSRAAFKLIEIDERFRLLKRGSRVIDLGCAPGGWVQVAKKRGAAHVVGVDLLPVDPVPGADILQADFTDPAIGPQLIELMGGKPDIVLSDLAHNTVGHKQTDHLKIMGLLEMAGDFALDNLKPGGAFVAKAFQGGETEQLLLKLKHAFEVVKHMKPKSSRAGSTEIYIVATGFKG